MKDPRREPDWEIREPATDPQSPGGHRRYSDKIEAVRNIAVANTNAIMELSKRLDRHERNTAEHLRQLRDEIGATRAELGGLMRTLIAEVQQRNSIDREQDQRVTQTALELERVKLAPGTKGALGGAGAAGLVELAARLWDWLR